jgi:hypothetical protein
MRIPCKFSTYQLPWDQNDQKMLHFLLAYIKVSLVCTMSIWSQHQWSLHPLVHGEEAIFPIEFQIPSLHLAIEILLDTTPLEERLVMMECKNEDHHVALQAIEAIK